MSNQSDAMSEGFNIFLYSCHTSLREGVTWANWWTTIANGVYISATTQEGDIRSPIHRIILRLVYITINMRKDADKVPNLDVFFLWSIFFWVFSVKSLTVWKTFYRKIREIQERGTNFLGYVNHEVGSLLWVT